MVDGLMKMMANEKFIGPVNLGNPNEITIKQLAEEIITVSASKSKIVYKPLPVDDPERRKPDISLAKAKLNWSVKVNRKTGLKKTIDYFKDIIK
jgi:UDP-glucuronate decarboxylase